MMLNALGFVYVNLVNLGNDRPFMSRHNTYYDIAYLIYMSVIIYFIGGIVTFRSKYALSGYCDNIEDAQYYSSIPENNPRCYVYSDWEIIYYNTLFWVLPCIVGLNFTHADKGII